MNLGTLKLYKFLITLIFFTFQLVNANNIDFDLIKKGQNNNNTLLIIGGIQGDEPGGFMAASLIATHYTITKGSVWIVPNLNFDSIIKRSRGRFGDMNRKFSNLSKNDPDYKNVSRIKELILEKDVKLVLNLHDGSGFYRKQFIDKMHSPYRWGQSSIIDQSNVRVQNYGNLLEISQKVCDAINKKLLKKEHAYLVRNTKTKDGDFEMEKSLTYFAINRGKAAYANEASKSLPVHERTYYHLLALEEYMKQMGIEFERNFKLQSRSLKNVIDNDISISFYDDKIKLPLEKIRNIINYFPIDKNGIVKFQASNPLMTVLKDKDMYAVHYGNRRVVRLSADYLEMYKLDSDIQIDIDGISKSVKIGSLINVSKNFLVYPKEELRVNIIGYYKKNIKNEAGYKISKKQISRKFSLDKKGKIYRVEFYNKINNKFAGMVLVKFVKNLKVSVASNSLSKNTNTFQKAIN